MLTQPPPAATCAHAGFALAGSRSTGVCLSCKRTVDVATVERAWTLAEALGVSLGDPDVDLAELLVVARPTA